ncbi:hypothetical protein ACYZTX_29005 [Pseudomonas sp. MDT1-17]
MPMIDTKPLRHAQQPEEQAEAAYHAAYTAVKAATAVDTGAAMDKVKKVQHVYHDACRRLCSDVRQAIDIEEAVAALARWMELTEDDKDVASPIMNKDADHGQTYARNAVSVPLPSFLSGLPG